MRSVRNHDNSLNSCRTYAGSMSWRPLSLRRNLLGGFFVVIVGLSFGVCADTTRERTIDSAIANTEWLPLSIVDIHELPWDEQPRFLAKTKTFFRGPETGAFIYCQYSPTWNIEQPAGGLGPHYHLWHEWAYMLKGDLVIMEPVSPYQANGARYRFIEGTWLDRPAYSLHGGSWVTGGTRSQNPATFILLEEGDGSVVTVGPNGDHFKPDFPDSKPEPYKPDWQSVPEFRRPWIVDSGSDLEWEVDSEVAGRFVKWLSDDKGEGFRAQLVKIPPGWTAPEGTKKTYFQEANRLRYVVYGDMQVWLFDDPESAGKTTKVSEDFFVQQPPRSIWGYGAGPVSEQGAVWLEVTYAKGLAVGGGPIEEPIAIQ